jgi:hypothetical protein
MEAEDSKLYNYHYEKTNSHKERIYIKPSIVPGYNTYRLACTALFAPRYGTDTL